MRIQIIVDTLAWIVAQNFVATAIMIPFVVLLCRAFRNRPAVQSLLWSIVLLKFLIPPVPYMAWELPSLSSVVASTEQRHLHSPPPHELLPFDPLESPSLVVVDATELDDAFKKIRTRPKIVPTKVPPKLIWRDLVLRYLLLVWIVGSAMLFLRQSSRIRKRYRIVQKAIPANRRLSEVVNGIAKSMGVNRLTTVIVPRIASPFLSCLFRIRLVWPDALIDCDSKSIRAIVAHEVAHLRRRDHWISWLELIVSLIWWWNPLFWFVRNRLRVSSEMACDAMAIATYPEDRCLYAETLLWLSAAIETGAPPLTLAVSGGTPSSLERRMRMIVSVRVSDKLPIYGLAAAVLLSLSSVPSLTVAQSGEQPKVLTIKTPKPSSKLIEHNLDLDDLQLVEELDELEELDFDADDGDLDLLVTGDFQLDHKNLERLEKELKKLSKKLTSLNLRRAEKKLNNEATDSQEAVTKIEGEVHLEVDSTNGEKIVVRSEDGKAVIEIIGGNGKSSRLSGDVLRLSTGRSGEMIVVGEGRITLQNTDQKISTDGEVELSADRAVLVIQNDDKEIEEHADGNNDGNDDEEESDNEENQETTKTKRFDVRSLVEKSVASLRQQAEMLREQEQERAEQLAEEKERIEEAKQQIEEAKQQFLSAKSEMKAARSMAEAAKKLLRSAEPPNPPIAPVVRVGQVARVAPISPVAPAAPAAPVAPVVLTTESDQAGQSISRSSRNATVTKSIDLISLATAYADAVSVVETTTDAQAKQRASRKATLLRRIAKLAYEAAIHDVERLEKSVKAGQAPQSELKSLEARREILKEILATEDSNQSK